MKLIKDTWNKIIEMIDDMTGQLGLQHKPVPVRVKKDNDRNKK